MIISRLGQSCMPFIFLNLYLFPNHENRQKILRIKKVQINIIFKIKLEWKNADSFTFIKTSSGRSLRWSLLRFGGVEPSSPEIFASHHLSLFCKVIFHRKKGNHEKELIKTIYRSQLNLYKSLYDSDRIYYLTALIFSNLGLFLLKLSVLPDPSNQNDLS